jgi:hypothetical protein
MWLGLFVETYAGNRMSGSVKRRGTTDVWLNIGGTAGKPGEKRREQTSTRSIGRNRSTRLNNINQFNQFLEPRVRVSGLCRRFAANSCPVTPITNPPFRQRGLFSPGMRSLRILGRAI